MPTRRETAYHEAGHAVADHVLGLRVERVTINPVGVFGGLCQSSPAGAPVVSQEFLSDLAAIEAKYYGRVAPPVATLEGEALDRQLVQLLAGPEAQRRYTRSGSHGDSSDMAQARRLLGAGRRSMWDLCADLADARERTRLLLDEHWPAVEAVALALQASGTLSGDQVRLLIATAPARGAA